MKREIITLFKNNSIVPNILHCIFLITITGAFSLILKGAIPGQVEHSNIPKSGVDAEGGAFNKKKAGSQTQIIPKKMDLLSVCVKDANTKYHYHANLSISIFGRRYPLTKDIGNQDGCLHPLQVHDDISGGIHIHSLVAYPYTLGDFFTTWGFIFNHDQFGSIFITPAYHMTMKVNGKITTDYEKHISKDNDQITISIDKK